MTMKILNFLVAFMILAATVARAGDPAPPDGFVPNEKIAIVIAVTVWSRLYGEKMIKAEQPYKAVLKNGVWHVEGTLPPGVTGGVAEIDIAKADGKILKVNHGK